MPTETMPDSQNTAAGETGGQQRRTRGLLAAARIGGRRRRGRDCGRSAGGLVRLTEPPLRVCGCVHVRTGTLVLALWHLAMNLLTMSALITVLLRPQLAQQRAASNDGRVGGVLPDGHDGSVGTIDELLPTPTINTTGNQSSIVFETEDAPDRLHSDDVPPPRVMPKHSRGYSVFGGQIWHSDDINIGILVTFCLFIITLLMLIGTIRGQPSYLMPFFCLQVFDFCISCLTLVSYLSLLPDARHLVSQWPHLPWRRQLLLLDVRWLALIVVVVFLVVMAIKAYLIGMVWSCYRYLLMRQTLSLPVSVVAQQSHTAGRADAADTILPDYHTALSDSRFAKIDLALYPLPPPSYDTATASATSDAASCAANSGGDAEPTARATANASTSS